MKMSMIYVPELFGPTWVEELPLERRQALRRGETIDVGTRRYKVCGQCRCVVQQNKFLIGAAHLCI